jgi:hydroxymethylglutaryl-CoA reductase
MMTRRRAELLGTATKIALALTVPSALALAAIALVALPFAAVILGAMELKRRSDAEWNAIKAQEHAMEVARLQSSEWAFTRAKDYWTGRKGEFNATEA